MLPMLEFFPRLPTALLAGALAGAAVLVAPPLAADWRFGAEGGAVVRDGDSATRLRLTLDNADRPLTHSLYAEAVFYSEGNGTRVGYRPRFWFDDSLYAFGDAEARIDRPLLIDRGLLLIGGVGYRLIDTPTTAVGVEVGAGARSTRFETIADEDPVEDTEGLVLLRADASRELADLLRIELDADVLQGETLGEIRAEVALSYRVSGGAVRLGYRVRRLSFDGGATVDDDDFSVGFTYGF